jgi:hypothetical protein
MYRHAFPLRRLSCRQLRCRTTFPHYVSGFRHKIWIKSRVPGEAPYYILKETQYRSLKDFTPIKGGRHKTRKGKKATEWAVCNRISTPVLSSSLAVLSIFSSCASFCCARDTRSGHALNQSCQKKPAAFSKKAGGFLKKSRRLF